MMSGPRVAAAQRDKVVAATVKIVEVLADDGLSICEAGAALEGAKAAIYNAAHLEKTKPVDKDFCKTVINSY